MFFFHDFNSKIIDCYHLPHSVNSCSVSDTRMKLQSKLLITSLKQGNYFRLLRWIEYNHMSSLKTEDKVRREKSDINRLWSRSEQCNVRIQQAIIDFEDGGRGAQAKELPA